VFEYGSFLQKADVWRERDLLELSRSSFIEAARQGQALCGQCLLPAKFDAEGHQEDAL
jgi:hypothetical protein